MTEEIEPLEPVGFSRAIDNAKGDSPWDTESIAGWNTPAYWTAYYRAWRTLADPDDRYAEVDREISSGLHADGRRRTAPLDAADAPGCRLRCGAHAVFAPLLSMVTFSGRPCCRIAFLKKRRAAF